MKPYYQHGGITIYNCDCREILPSLQAIDLVLTDPPYGVGYSHGTWAGNLAGPTQFDHHPIIGDDEPFDPAMLLAFPNLVLWGGNHYASRLPDSPGWLVWDKREGIPSNDQADCEMAWTTLDKPARLKRHLWNGMLKGSERGERRYHPTQKPLVLMAWCLSFFPNARTVCDPYMGSGTTLKAAKNANLNAVGIEIDESYCEIAAQRLSQEVFSFEETA